MKLAFENLTIYLAAEIAEAFYSETTVHLFIRRVSLSEEESADYCWMLFLDASSNHTSVTERDVEMFARGFLSGRKSVGG